MNAQDELKTYIRAKYPLIYIVSQEERRVETSIGAIATSLGMGVRTWSLTSGFSALDGSAQEAAPDPQLALNTCTQTNTKTVFILKDFHPFFATNNAANVPVIRTAKDVARQIKNSNISRCIVFLGPKLELPEDLKSEVVVIEWPLPTEIEIKAALDSIVNSLPADIQKNIATLNGEKEEVVRSARGLTLEEAQNCFAKSLVLTKTLDPSIISAEKKQIIAKDGLLEWIEPEGGLDQVGGLNKLKTWLKQRLPAFGNKAAKYGLPKPKGIAVVGLPGTGKSLCAKAAGLAWRMPVLRLDMGKLYGSLLGESEANLRRALRIAESASPCILMLDEIDKGFGGSESSNGSTDGGTSTRMLGAMLTWMQEKKSSVFVFATLNRVEGLPPELLRRGRFDELFFVDLPNYDERKAIWQIHISKRNRSGFDLNNLAQQSNGYSGAEIEAAFIDGMFEAFSQDKEVTESHVLTALQASVPLSKMAAERIAAMREWAKGRAKSASNTDSEESNRFGALNL